MSCRQAPGAKYETGDGPRPRDADLAQRDRVDVLIDLDRDGATAYRLTMDHRGWTSEAAAGDTTWNPTWFVAAQTADGDLDRRSGYPTGRNPPASVRQPKAVWAIGRFKGSCRALASNPGPRRPR